MEKQLQPREQAYGAGPDQGLKKGLQRRLFLKYAGTAAVVSALVLTGCDKDDDDGGATGGLDLGSGDVGLLNYSYALEQLLAAFYIQAVNQKYNGITGSEQTFLEEIRDHAIAHREFLKAALGTNAIPSLETDLNKVDFRSRASVINTAKSLEDLMVSAYNGAARLYADASNLIFTAKIVSVKARHAAAIRDMINPKSADFAGDDVVNANGLDIQRTPAEVLAIAGTYLKTSLFAGNLPK